MVRMTQAAFEVATFEQENPREPGVLGLTVTHLR
jgi:hypothetical protein